MADIVRTLSVVNQLASGKRLHVPDGIIGMGEDMSIGYMHGERISGLATIDLAQLDQISTKYGIGFAFESSPVWSPANKHLQPHQKSAG
jgi:hypothetical protein